MSTAGQFSAQVIITVGVFLVYSAMLYCVTGTTTTIIMLSLRNFTSGLRSVLIMPMYIHAQSCM